MVWTSLDRYRDAGLLVVRVGFGLGMLWYHGLPKLTGGSERWTGTGEAMASLGVTFGAEWFGLAAALAEGVGGLLIAAGLFFRPTAAVLAFVMFVATANHMVTGEGTPAHAFKNVWLFTGLVLTGPGRYSLDYLLARRRSGTDRVEAFA
jgi:putative oxidoreductase